MSDFVSNPFPSRIFVRFIAYKQLTADATGHMTTLKAKRRDKGLFYQQFLPGYPVSTQILEDSVSLEEMGSTENDRALVDLKSSGFFPGRAFSTTDASPDISGKVDDGLFEDIINTTITPQRWPELYQACKTTSAATELELKAAAAIVVIYRRIKVNQANSLVQQLNQLL